MVNKSQQERVTSRQSAYMHMMHNDLKLSIRKLAKKFPQFSLATVYRHATKSVFKEKTKKGKKNVEDQIF